LGRHSFDPQCESERLFLVEAFLPRPDADPSKIGTGQYLSIDSRPVSHEKGTMKKIISIYKKYVRAALVDTEKLKNPFIRLNIKCPIAAYDANVEPAKDDVIFANESSVLELVESLFKDVYGGIMAAPAVSLGKANAEVAAFDILLSGRGSQASESPMVEPHHSFLPPNSFDKSSSSAVFAPEIMKAKRNEEIPDKIDVPESTRHMTWESDRSTGYNKEIESGKRLDNPSQSLALYSQQTQSQAESIENTLNPWIIAKMNAPMARFETTSLPRHNTDEEDLSGPNLPLRVSSASDTQYSDDDDLFIEESPRQSERRTGFISARNFRGVSLMTPPASHFKKGLPKSGGTDMINTKPFKRNEPELSPGALVQTTLFANHIGHRDQNISCQSTDSSLLLTNSNSELAWAMDFEQRKDAATRQRRAELRKEQMMPDTSNPVRITKSSPHKNRFGAAVAALKASNDDSQRSEHGTEIFKTTLPNGDPRAYLMRRQRSVAAKKSLGIDTQPAMRAKSTKLPLEVIPKADSLYKLAHTVSVNQQILPETTAALAKHDDYVCYGLQIDGLAIKPPETALVVEALQHVVSKWLESNKMMKCEVEYKSGSLLEF
jgi:hypothetical protein